MPYYRDKDPNSRCDPPYGKSGAEKWQGVPFPITIIIITTITAISTKAEKCGVV